MPNIASDVCDHLVRIPLRYVEQRARVYRLCRSTRSARGGTTSLTPRERPHERTEPKERERDERRVESL